MSNDTSPSPSPDQNNYITINRNKNNRIFHTDHKTSRWSRCCEDDCTRTGTHNCSFCGHLSCRRHTNYGVDDWGYYQSCPHCDDHVQHDQVTHTDTITEQTYATQSNALYPFSYHRPTCTRCTRRTSTPTTTSNDHP